MRLRNKKTGEILNGLGSFIIQNPNHINCEAITRYNSLAELNAEWEDAPEEPKGYWFIRDDCSGIGYSPIGNSTVAKRRKKIGNYFESKEEAEKAAEKLKAWKRLKDKGFRFYRWNKGSLLKSLPNTIEFACDDTEMWTWGDIQDDLDLLFSGGEE